MTARTLRLASHSVCCRRKMNGYMGTQASDEAVGRRMEAERVILLRPDWLPLAVGRTWEKMQERNVEYVALTRSQHELIFAEN